MCGHRLEDGDSTACSLCGFEFKDDHATGVDITPYAKCYARGMSGWRLMLPWIWFCGNGRLKHLAMMRSSSASRRFARINLFLLTVGVGLLEVSRTGWWRSDVPQPVDGTGFSPLVAEGWRRVAMSPSVTGGPTGIGSPTELWWNPLHSAVAMVVCWVVAFALCAVFLGLLRAGTMKAYGRAIKSDERMTAALHYGTAWCVPLALAAATAALRPIAFVATVSEWSSCPTDSGFILSAVVLAAFSTAMWWFWLIRLGATAQAKSRIAVVAFFSIGAPAMAAAASVGWWFGIGYVYNPLLRYLGLES